MSSVHEQQPIQRTVGRRRSREGQPLTADDRAAIATHARYRTRVPKGIFRYRSHAEMEADRVRWQVAAVVEEGRGP